MRGRRIAGFISLAALAVAAGAQGARAAATADAKAESPARNPSVLAYRGGVRSATNERNLDIRRLDLRVTVRGAVAISEMTLSVHSQGPSDIEGHVRIALPSGAVVTGYALDVAGEMVEGSLVEAARAEAAYERQVRGQIDPGLATVDTAGAFTTRVFPIDQDKGRRLRLRFVTPVANGYRLPIDLPAPRDGWTVVVSGAEGRVRLGDDDLDRRGAEAVLTGRRAVRGELVIEAPRAAQTLASLHSGGEIYWQLSGTLPARQPRTGGTMRIYWDRSRSRRDQDHGAALARLREAVRALAPAKIEWVAFSSGPVERATVTSPEDVERRAKAVRYAGATSFAVLASDAPADTCLLVSDGQLTLEEGKAEPPKCRLFAIAPALGSNVARLTSLAQATGGRFVAADRSHVDWRAPTVERVLDASGKALPFLSLGSAPDRWTAAVRAPTRGPVRVVVGGSAEQRQPGAAPVPFDGEGALLAHAQLATMEGTADRAAFVALSRRFSIASPTLSFVVLEQPEDYVRNGIEPPAGYRRQAEYAELALADGANRKAAEQNRFAQLLKDWTEQVAWYDRRFDLTARPPQPEPKARAVERQGTAAPPLSVAPPPPPPPPAPMAEADSSAEIVVTGGRVRRTNLDSAAPVTVVGGAQASRDVAISVNAWLPDRDYLKAYDATPGDFDRLYAEWDRKAGGVPAFYLDTADWLHRRQRRDEAEQVLTSALDLPTANQVTLGMVAARLERYGLLDRAIALRERQALLDPDRPQPKRLLALALARRAVLGGAGARADLERAIGLLVEIALKPVDVRWAGIDLISLVEANALLVRLRALGGDVALDPRLVRDLASDVRIVIDWSNDATDVDLWVDEPNGERAIYNNPRTRIGGRLSNDMTQGFGPEEYRIRRAAPGAYIVRANAFAPDRLDPNGAARVTGHLYRDWGRSTERVEAIDFDVSQGSASEIRIGTLTVDRPGEEDGEVTPPREEKGADR